MNVQFLEVARQELDEAISYYNQQSPGLGDAFVLEVVSAIDRISRFPEAWHPMGDEIRRCRLRRFPHGLIYAIENDESSSSRSRTGSVNQGTGETDCRGDSATM